jgi:general stress protein 26
LLQLKKDGSSHVVPICFVLDDNNSSRARVENIIFTTNSISVKAKNIQYNNRVSICVDDQTPPFSFVIVYGNAKIYHYKQNDRFKWATKIAERYMGKSNAEAYGRRNSTEGEVLVRIKSTKLLQKKIQLVGIMISL